MESILAEQPTLCFVCGSSVLHSFLRDALPRVSILLVSRQLRQRSRFTFSCAMGTGRNPERLEHHYHAKWISLQPFADCHCEYS